MAYGAAAYARIVWGKRDLVLTSNCRFEMDEEYYATNERLGIPRF